MSDERESDARHDVVHTTHFTVAEANALLPKVKPVLRQLRDAKDLLVDPEARAVLAEASPTNGGGPAGRQVGEAFLEVRALLKALTDAGIVIRDIDRGLVDFPAIREGREVYLCWELGEDRVGFWHDLESGYRGRKPLD